LLKILAFEVRKLEEQPVDGFTGSDLADDHPA